MEGQIFVGYNRQTVTPEEPIPLTGYSNEPQRFHTSIGQEICVTCVAISDSDDTTVLMVGLDCCRLPVQYTGEGLAKIAEQVGVPKDRIYLAATHTHAAPALGWVEQYPSVARYSDLFEEKMITAMREALADRKPATMRTGSIETENMNFIKHYKCKVKGKDEICYIGDQFGDPDRCNLLEHATKVDPTMHVLQFQREGGKDVVIANFRAHPHFDGGYEKYVMSSDYIGAFRKALEALVDCHVVYFQGACGNVNSSTRMPSERRYTTAASYGLGLAGYAAECIAKRMSPAQTGKIKTKQMEVFGEINHTMNHLAKEAAEINHVWYTTFDRKKCDEMSLPLGIRSPYHAGAIEWNSQRTKEKDGGMILNAASIGEQFAFVTFPGEMFDSVSVRMEENSPYNMTMMLGYCYHHIGYLPSAVAYKYTSYETDVTRFAPGTGEMVADTHVAMLKELKNGK